MKSRKKTRKTTKKWPLVGIKRELAYHLLAEGMPDEEICKKLEIKPANLAKAKSPYFLKRVELMRLGAETFRRMRHQATLTPGRIPPQGYN